MSDYDDITRMLESGELFDRTPLDPKLAQWMKDNGYVAVISLPKPITKKQEVREART